MNDMLSQPNWPEGHQELIYELIKDLENRKGLQLNKINWYKGIIKAVKE